MVEGKIAFAGLRPEQLPFDSEDDPLCLALKARMRMEVRKAFMDKFKHYMVGIDRGCGFYFAEELRRLIDERYPLEVEYVSCSKFDEFWDEADILRHDEIIMDKYRCVQTLPNRRTNKRRHDLKNFYYDRNNILSSAELVIVIHDRKDEVIEDLVNQTKSRYNNLLIIDPRYPNQSATW